MKKQKTSLGTLAATVWMSLLIAAGPVAAQEFRDYYVTDVVGSPVVSTDENTNSTWTEDYLPYGQKRTLSASQSNGGDNERAFTGAVQNELSGLVDLGNRSYDPITGRFLSVDTVGVSMDDGGNFNRYWYGNNNPYKFVDPDGRLPIVIPIIVGITWLFASDAANAPTPTDVPVPRGDAARAGIAALAPLPGSGLIPTAASRGLGPAGSGAAGSGGQLTANACGMACGQRVLANEGISVFQSNLTRGFYRGLTPEQLAANLNRFSPGYRGLMGYPTVAQLRGLAKNGPFIARLGGNPGHFVTVESIEKGVVKFFDPSGGAIKTQALDDFAEIVSGVVYKP